MKRSATVLFLVITVVGGLLLVVWKRPPRPDSVGEAPSDQVRLVPERFSFNGTEENTTLTHPGADDFGTEPSAQTGGNIAPSRRERFRTLLAEQSEAVSAIPFERAEELIWEPVVSGEDFVPEETALWFMAAEPESFDLAVEVFRQLGTPSDALFLREISTLIPDPYRQVAILEAAEFLQLPTVSSLRGQGSSRGSPYNRSRVP